MSRLRSLVCIGALLGAGPALAAPTRVAIVVHPVVNVPEAESRAIATELAAAMRRRYDAELIAGEVVTKKMPTNVPEDCVSQAGCVGEVGDRIGADQLLFLVMIRVGDKVQVDATWADIQSGRTLPRDSFELEGPPEARRKVIAEVAPTMLPRGEVPVLGSVEAKIETKPEHRMPAVPATDPWGEERRDPQLGAWVAASVSVASLGVAVALILGGLSDYNAQIESGCPEQPEPVGSCVAVVDRFGSRSTATSLLLIGSALAGATSIALFASHAASLDATASVVVDDDGAGLTLGGRF